MREDHQQMSKRGDKKDSDVEAEDDDLYKKHFFSMKNIVLLIKQVGSTNRGLCLLMLM